MSLLLPRGQVVFRTAPLENPRETRLENLYPQFTLGTMPTVSGWAWCDAATLECVKKNATTPLGTNHDEKTKKEKTLKYAESENGQQATGLCFHSRGLSSNVSS
eukprot:s557_g25.t1